MSKGVIDTVFKVVDHTLKEREKQRRKDQAEWERYLAKLDKAKRIAAGEELARLETVKLLSRFDSYEYDVRAAYNSRNRVAFEPDSKDVEQYVKSLVEYYRIDADFIVRDYIGYNDFTDTLVLECELEDPDDVFFAGSYKFLKGQFAIAEVQMKASEKADRYRRLVSVIIDENVKVLMGHGIRHAVVNLFVGEVYLASCDVNRETYENGSYVQDIKIFKSLSTGIEPYEYLWMRGDR